MNIIQKKIQAIMQCEGANNSFAKLFLYIMSLIYGKVVKIRTYLYFKRIFKINKLPCYVISIGNISSGGTGKTPMTIFLAKMLKKIGYKIVIISRGYKGTFQKKGGIVSDGFTIFMTPNESGDEPFMMANILKDIPIIVGQNRFEIGMIAIDKFKPDIILLDDAFQHIKLSRNINLLLLDYDKPFGNTHLLPRGVLREPISSISRSDVIILTRYKQTDYINHDLSKIKKPIFKSFYNLSIINQDNKAGIKNTSDLNGLKAFVFSGIAQNKDFHNTLIGLGIIISDLKEFQDHHFYNEKDLKTIEYLADKSKATVLITTEKDYAKIAYKQNWLVPIIVIGVNTSFGEMENEFESFIKSYLL